MSTVIITMILKKIMMIKMKTAVQMNCISKPLLQKYSWQPIVQECIIYLREYILHISILWCIIFHINSTYISWYSLFTTENIFYTYLLFGASIFHIYPTYIHQIFHIYSTYIIIYSRHLCHIHIFIINHTEYIQYLLIIWQIMFGKQQLGILNQ